MKKHFTVLPDVEIISAHFALPGAGFLPVNAFVIKAEEPVLIDTGMGIESEEFMKSLTSIIDPKELKWILLTHDDADHTGSIMKVLETAPNARLVANSLAVLRMSSSWPVPMHRVYWMNSGDSLTVGDDRKLTAVRPPLFDNPTTLGFYDDKSEVFFSADCFGAIIPGPVQNTDDLTHEELSQGMISWASADSPWLHMVLPQVFGQALERIRKMAPRIILSAHLPPARGKTNIFLKWLAEAPTSTPFVSPNQEALEQLLAQK